MLVLSDLGDGERVADQIILNWVNTTLSQKRKDSQISSFKVSLCVFSFTPFKLRRLSDGCWLLLVLYATCL